MDYIDQINAEIRKSRKMKIGSRLFYYEQMKQNIACVSFEVYKGSWAYESWLKKNISAIQEFVDTQNERFGWQSSKKWTV